MIYLNILLFYLKSKIWSNLVSRCVQQEDNNENVNFMSDANYYFVI